MSIDPEEAVHERAALLEKMPQEPVDWREFSEIVAHAEPWDPIQFPDDHDWFLIKEVPLSAFPEITVGEIEDVEDPDEREEHRERYNVIKRLLQEGAEPWAVIVASNGMVIDGFHRVAAMQDLGRKTVDVLYVLV